MQGERIFSGSPYEEKAGYARAAVAGGWIFVSGTTGFDAQTKEFPADVETQCENCFRNIEIALEGQERLSRISSACRSLSQVRRNSSGLSRSSESIATRPGLPIQRSSRSLLRHTCVWRWKRLRSLRFDRQIAGRWRTDFSNPVGPQMLVEFGCSLIGWPIWLFLPGDSSGLVILQRRCGDGTIDVHRRIDCRSRIWTIVKYSPMLGRTAFLTATYAIGAMASFCPVERVAAF